MAYWMFMFDLVMFACHNIRTIWAPQTRFEHAIRKTTCDPDVIWTRNLLNWSQTRYRCATKPVIRTKNCYSTILEILARLWRFWMTYVRALERAWNFKENRSWASIWGGYACVYILLDKTPLYPKRGSNTQPSVWRVDALPLRHERS